MGHDREYWKIRAFLTKMFYTGSCLNRIIGNTCFLFQRLVRPFPFLETTGNICSFKELVDCLLWGIIGSSFFCVTANLLGSFEGNITGHSKE